MINDNEIAPPNANQPKPISACQVATHEFSRASTHWARNKALGACLLDRTSVIHPFDELDVRKQGRASESTRYVPQNAYTTMKEQYRTCLDQESGKKCAELLNDLKVSLYYQAPKL